MSIKGLIDQVVRGSTSSPAHPAEQGDYVSRDKSRDSAKYFSLEVSTARDDVLRYLQHSLAFTLVIGVVLFAATASTKFWSGEGVYDAQALFRMAAESNSGKQILLHRITGAVNIHGKVDFSEQIIFQSERGATESYLTRRLPLANEHGEIEYTFKPVRVRHTYGDLQKLSPEREMEVKQNPINGFVILGLGEDKRPFSPGINEITLQYSAKGIVSEKEGELSLSWNPLEERHYNTRNLEIIITNLTGQQLHPFTERARVFKTEKDHFRGKLYSDSLDATKVVFSPTCKASNPLALVCLSANERLGYPPDRSLHLSATFALPKALEVEDEK